MRSSLIITLALAAATSVHAQSVLYPQHFELSEVTLLDSPFKTAMELNDQLLLQYDVDRLLTPFVRQAGLSDTSDSGSKYYQWTLKHPKFINWGDDSFNLEGHVGGHYLSALALAYAAATDATTQNAMKERMDYMINVLYDCQQAYATDNTGLKGFLGGQPINSVWQALYKGETQPMYDVWGWVPFYCEHKMLAGLRDAYVYGKSEKAKEIFRHMADWTANVVARLSDSDMEGILRIEHGGVNETLADAYAIFGDMKYLTAAKRYSHKTMLDGMQTPNATFLDNLHANTQVPKYVGMERVGEFDAAATNYLTAATNFWNDVAQNRTVAIGGNSVSEHFLEVKNSNKYIDNLEGPESCNTNNMLKLTEMLADRTHDARYADFYEYAMLNHILSTQDPTTGGYVYFTTLRPDGYRIYSQVNQGMWCCVGTGMENHSKYGHFVYTHDDDTLYVNLFIASKLNNKQFKLTQETRYPYATVSKITIEKGGKFTLAVRHPWWTTDDYSISVNGKKQTISVEKGTASYAKISRKWKAGDEVTVTIPMEMRYEPCPNYTDYVAFEYGPVLLAAQTTASSESEAAKSGLKYEQLQNEYGGEGRMDHSPGAMGKSHALTDMAMLIGDRSEVLSRITPKDLSQLTFTIDASTAPTSNYQWTTLELQPFYGIHHARYQLYWYQQTQEGYEASEMNITERKKAALDARTIDYVATGEQQSEAGHKVVHPSISGTGSYNSETYRDAGADGFIQYTLYNKTLATDRLSIMLRFTTSDAGRMGYLSVDGVKIADITVESNPSNMEATGFYNLEIPIPTNLMTNDDGSAKTEFVVRLTASSTTNIPGLYYERLLHGNK